MSRVWAVHLRLGSAVHIAVTETRSLHVPSDPRALSFDLYTCSVDDLSHRFCLEQSPGNILALKQLDNGYTVHGSVARGTHHLCCDSLTPMLMGLEQSHHLGLEQLTVFLFYQCSAFATQGFFA